jgi:hypothetical protein
MIKRAETHAPWIQSGKCHLCLYPKIEIKVELYIYKVLGMVEIQPKRQRFQVLTFSKVEVPYNLNTMKKHDKVPTKANNSIPL